MVTSARVADRGVVALEAIALGVFLSPGSSSAVDDLFAWTREAFAGSVPASACS